MWKLLEKVGNAFAVADGHSLPEIHDDIRPVLVQAEPPVNRATADLRELIFFAAHIMKHPGRYSPAIVQETADDLDRWADKLDHQAYVRLT